MAALAPVSAKFQGETQMRYVYALPSCDPFMNGTHSIPSVA